MLNSFWSKLSIRKKTQQTYNFLRFINILSPVIKYNQLRLTAFKKTSKKSKMRKNIGCLSLKNYRTKWKMQIVIWLMLRSLRSPNSARSSSISVSSRIHSLFKIVFLQRSAIENNQMNYWPLKSKKKNKWRTNSPKLFIIWTLNGTNH